MNTFSQLQAGAVCPLLHLPRVFFMVLCALARKIPRNVSTNRMILGKYSLYLSTYSPFIPCKYGIFFVSLHMELKNKSYGTDFKY